MSAFEEVWAIDFEYRALDGSNPEVVCMVAHEVISGRRLRMWADELTASPPFRTDDRVLFLSYFACAEMSAFLSLHWPLPRRLLDLYTEYRVLANGRQAVKRGLLDVAAAFGLAHMASAEKTAMRDRILAGPPFTPAEKVAILNYCAADVDLLVALLPKMLPGIVGREKGLGRALFRGRYMQAVARMERTGIPVDVDLLSALNTHWNTIKRTLIAEVDSRYGVFEGETFKQAKLEALVERMRIAWPRTETGRLSVEENVFREMTRKHPELDELRELLVTLGQMRLFELPVGRDGRNRCLLSPFGAITGRNTPSSKKYIFGPATWMRSLIKPAPGRAIAYCDWTSQEVAIAAVLSGDERLLKVVRDGDPYLGFARLAGLAPEDATKATHGKVRDFCKMLFLGVSYGMGEETLAGHLGRSTAEARQLLRLYRETFAGLTAWTERQCDRATLAGRTETVFGWPLIVTAATKPTTLRNFPIQATGAEILRLACCLATERNINVCGPVHDALLIEDSADRIGRAVNDVRECMDEASRIVLNGLAVKVDVKIIRYPDRYHDGRGKALFEKVSRLLGEVVRLETA
ncbi:MAG TPA: DNA polymerase [Pseudaminobacter sp.]|nr:DNA polymerase [Pseudaminobacter sp.]